MKMIAATMRSTCSVRFSVARPPLVHSIPPLAFATGNLHAIHSWRTQRQSSWRWLQPVQRFSSSTSAASSTSQTQYTKSANGSITSTTKQLQGAPLYTRKPSLKPTAEAQGGSLAESQPEPVPSSSLNQFFLTTAQQQQLQNSKLDSRASVDFPNIPIPSSAASPSSLSSSPSNQSLNLPFWSSHIRSEHVLLQLLILLNIFIFIQWTLAMQSGNASAVNWLGKHFTVTATNIREGRLWTFFTATFSHYSLAALCVNMGVVTFTSLPLIRLYGALPFVCFYLTAGEAGWVAFLAYRTDLWQKYTKRIQELLKGSKLDPTLASATNSAVQPSPASPTVPSTSSAAPVGSNAVAPADSTPPYRGIGASGAVFGVMAFSALAHAWNVKEVRGIRIPTGPLALTAVGLLLTRECYLLYESDPCRMQVSHEAHLAGALVGLLSFRFLPRRARPASNIASSLKTASQPRPVVYHTPKRSSSNHTDGASSITVASKSTSTQSLHQTLPSKAHKMYSTRTQAR